MADRDPLSTTPLMESLISERRKLQAAFERLTPEQWTLPGVCGAGTIKDGLADVIAHEQDALQTLQHALRDIPYAREYKDLEVFNQRVILDNRARPVGDLIEVWEQSYQKLIAAVSQLGENDLIASSPISKAAGAPIEKVVSKNTYELYAALRHEIETYLAGQKPNPIERSI